ADRHPVGGVVWYPAKAGLRSRDLYNTRHTFATPTLASGGDPGWVAKMLGDTTLTMLVTRYYGYVPNLVRQDGALLAAQLDRRRARSVAKRGQGVRRLPGLSRKR